METIKKLMMLCVAAFAAIGAFAAIETVNGITWKYTVSDGKASVSSGSSFSSAIPTATTGAITIPSTLGGYSVTSIGAFAFYDCSSLTSVTIPDSVTSIGSSAFEGCSGLTSITIPDSVTSIGNSAFSECYNLTGVYITDIASWCGISFGSDDYYFGGANPLEYAHDLYLNGSLVTDLVIPDGVSNIAPHAFCGCNLTSVTIPNSVTSVGDCAFSSDDTGPGSYSDYNMNLTNVTIGSSVTNIGVRAFYRRHGLSSVSIPNSVARIGQDAFSACNNDITTIPGVELVDGWAVGNSGRLLGHLDLTIVRGIADHAFYECWAVTSVTMPDNIVNIGDYAFYCCSGLTSVTIPDSVTSIGDSAFEGCSGLTSVTIPDSVASIGEWAFSGCDGLTSVTIGKGVTSIGDYAFSAGDDCAQGLASVLIPNNVTKIGNMAFSYWPNLVNARVPKALEKMIIERSVFKYCSQDLVVDYYDVQTCNFPFGIKDEVDIGLYGYTVKGLPKGLTYSAKTGKLSGTVNNAGVYEVTFSKNGESDVVVQIVVRKAYTVTFDANGGMPKTQSISLFPGSSFVLPDDPTRVGYVFTGWWTEKSGGMKVTESTTFGEDAYAQLYAHWKANRYMVVFDANGGTGTMDSRQMVYDVAAPLAGNGFAMPDSLLRGWATSADGDVVYRDGADVKNLSAIDGDVVTLFAVWQKKPDWVLDCESSLGEAGTVSLDANDNIAVTLTNDVSGTVEIPDNVGAVTVDLNGYVMTGNEGPAIRIVKGDGEGETTRLVIADTADGEKGQILGGGESAGIEVAEDAATGVRLDVEEGVGVFNGDGSEQELKPKLVGTGKVTVPRTWKVGQKVTWKATADKGSVFARWEGPLVDSLDLTKNERRNPSLAFVVPEGFETDQIKAVFIPIDDDGLYSLGITQTEFDLKETVSGVCVTDDSQSYVTATASGLPTGLKFDAKKMAITGTPTKSGVYWVQIKAKNASGYQWAENVSVTVPGGGTEAKEPKLTRTAHHPLTVICATEGGTASGTGVYAAGKKVSVKATPAKGYVFAGWHETANSEKGTVNGVDGADYRSASLKVTVPEMRYVFALFATKEDDADSLKVAVEDVTTEKDGTIALDLGACVESLSLPKLAVSGLPTGLKYDAKAFKVVGKATKPGVYTVTVKATNAAVTKATDASKATFMITVPNFECAALPGLKSETDAYGTIHAGVKFGPGLIDCTPEDGWTVKAAGLPAGLKFAAKETKDATYGVVPAWTIYGVPTAKAGAYTVTFTASKKGEKNQVATITLNVEALPTWAVGTFNGGGDLGQVSLTVAKTGKLSGKYLSDGLTWSLAANSFDSIDESGEVYRATLIGKSGKLAMTNEVGVACDSMGGFAESIDYIAYRNNWKLEPWKTIGKPFAKAAALEYEDSVSVAGVPVPGVLTLKFAASGAVTVKGSFVTGVNERTGKDILYTASGSAVLAPQSEPDETGVFDAVVFVYLPPKAGKFDGYVRCIGVRWTGEDWVKQ